MCPDKLTLSAFFDGELTESKQKEILSHTCECSACQEILMQFHSQHRLLQEETNLPLPGKESLDTFWHYAHHKWASRKLLHVDNGQLVISVPMAAAVLGVLLLSMILNLLPMLKKSDTSVVVLDQQPQPSTVISITVPPSELDSFLSLIEGTQGMTEENIYVLPFNLPVTQVGEPRIVRVANFEKTP